MFLLFYKFALIGKKLKSLLGIVLAVGRSRDFFISKKAFNSNLDYFLIKKLGSNF